MALSQYNFYRELSMFSLIKRRGGVSDIYELFRGKIAEQKKIRHLTDADIAKMTGYTTSTIRAFMCGVRENEKIATAIAQALEIER